MRLNLQYFGGRGSSGGKRSGGGGGGGSTSGSEKTIRGTSYTTGESVGFRETDKRIMLDNGDKIITNSLHSVTQERVSSDKSVTIFESQKGDKYEVTYKIIERNNYTSVTTDTVKKVKKWGK